MIALILGGVYLGCGLVTLGFVIWAELSRRAFLISHDRWPEENPETVGFRLATYAAVVVCWPMYWLLFMGLNP